MTSTRTVYLYTPRGYSPGYVYADFDQAVARLLKDENMESVSELILELEEWGVWHDIDPENKQFSIDDGSRIEQIDFIE